MPTDFSAYDGERQAVRAMLIGTLCIAGLVLAINWARSMVETTLLSDVVAFLSVFACGTFLENRRARAWLALAPAVRCTRALTVMTWLVILLLALGALSLAILFIASWPAGVNEAPPLVPQDSYELLSGGVRTQVTRLRFASVGIASSTAWHSLSLIATGTCLGQLMFADDWELSPPTSS